MRSAQEAVHLVAATVGFLSLFLLWLTVVWGLILRNGWAFTRIRHATVYGVHSTIALLGLTLAAVHAFSQLAVPGGTVRLVDQFIPFVNSADPIGVGAGALALELFLAAAVSVLAQRRLGYARWRALHQLTHAAFLLLVAHVLVSGSDVGSVWVWATVVAGWLITTVLWLATTPLIGVAKRRLSRRVPTRQRGVDLTVDVDARRCVRYGFCEQEAPEVFKLRTDGRLSYRPTVSPVAAEAALRAAEVCPARAIALGRLPTTTVMPRRPEAVDERPREPRQTRQSSRSRPRPQHVDESAGEATVTGAHRHGGAR